MSRERFFPCYTARLLLVALLLLSAGGLYGEARLAALSHVSLEAREPAGGAALLADTVRLPWWPGVQGSVRLRDSVPQLSPSLLHPPPQGWSAYWLRILEERLVAQRDSLWFTVAAVAPGEVRPSAARDPPPLAAPPQGGRGELSGAGSVAPLEGQGSREGEAAQTGLEIRIQGRTALGGTWTRMRPCTGISTLYCERQLAPRIAPELQLGATVRGTLLDRVHVAVDYDASREFDASNSIRIFYEGEPGEFVRRFELGDVSLALPTSQFLTRAIPSGNWGVRALGQAGPIELQALWAQQSGSVTTREFRQSLSSEGLVLQASAAWDDAGYAAGQFFFLFDPAEIRGYPHLDVRALTGAEGPPHLLPRGGVQLFRYEGGPPRQDGSTLILRAVPREPERASEAVTAPFRLLQAGVDYQLHPSGMWLALLSPLRDEEALGVAYVTLSGETVGERVGGGEVPPREIRLLKGLRATHEPGSATWPLEMRHVYRISGSDEVDPGSVRLVISRGEVSGGDLGRLHPRTGQALTFLQLFGLDQDAPAGEVDATRLYRPRDDDPATTIAGTYLVFPTLHPFAQPPPLPGVGLSAAEAAAALGSDANPGIYQAPDERARRQAARFRLNFSYATRSQGVRSVFSLGALGIREGSERIYLGGRLLERGLDYDMVYEIGEVQLRSPTLLSAAGPDAEIRATFEQKPLFAAAPTSVAGFTARLPLGERGELNLIGLSQRERSLERRPTLGAEPGSLLLGGVGGRLSVGAGWLDRTLRIDTAAVGMPRSEILLSGELAMSLPDPYGQGTAYLEDFEERDEIPLALSRHAWRLGSAPASHQRAEDVLPPTLDALTAGTLVWQHDYLDAAGRVAGSLRAGEIDRRIRVAGSDIESSVLYLTLDSRAAGPSWRSITSVLSPSGRDLRNHEYLEFYVRAGTEAALVLDLGTVSEDAFAMDAEGRTSGIDEHGRPWGLGMLDREWDPGQEVWTDAHDRRGLWNATCVAEPGAVYPLGDARANCTRGNGVPDTEDLNGNGVLDTDERVFRQVVRLGDAGSPYLVRDTAETGTAFRLYRLPIRGDAGVGAAPSEIQHVRHLRLTVVGEGRTALAIARMRLVGSRWEKRGEGGIAGGLLEAHRLPALPARLEVGPVSRLSDEAYLSPPGIVDQPQDPAAGFGIAAGIEYNEQALSLRYVGLAPGDRAEVYRTYESLPRNFLGYRQLRLWALAREGRRAGEGQGEGGEQLVLRVGSGPDNYYLYRTPLRRAGAPRAREDWGPEIVIDFSRWQRLRAEAERRRLERPTSGGEPLVLWSADSTYAVVVSERGRAPNLAAVRELSLGVWNGGTGVAAGEVWINDIRLAAAEQHPGAAGQLSLDVRGGNLFQTHLSYTHQSAHFRQLGLPPGYQGDATLSLHTTLHLGELLPARWGVRAPLVVSHQRSASQPLYVDQTDLDTRVLGEVRQPAAERTRITLELDQQSVRADSELRVRPQEGFRFRMAYQSQDLATPYTALQGAELDAALEYQLRPAARTVLLVPATPSAWSWLPHSLRTSTLVSGLSGLRLRWSPVSLSVSSAWSGSRMDHERYTHVLLAEESARPVQQSVHRRLNQQVLLQIRPFESLTGDATLRSSRDLLAPLLQNAQAAALLAADRLSFGALDLGREADRSLATRLTWVPRLTSWLSLHATAQGGFVMDQNPGFFRTGSTPGLPPVFSAAPQDGPSAAHTSWLEQWEDQSPLSRNGAAKAADYWERGLGGEGLVGPGDADLFVPEDLPRDSPLQLLRTFGSRRALSSRLTLEPQVLARALGYAAPPADSAAWGWGERLLASLRPLELRWGRTLESRFDRSPAFPGLAYQLGLGTHADFRTLHADSATRLLDATDWSARTELALPADLALRLAYGTRSSELLGRRSERGDRETEWPSALLEWTAVPIPTFLHGVVRNVALSSGYHLRSHRQVDRGAGEGRSATTTRLPLTLSASWLGGMRTTYRGEWTHGTGETPFASTRQIGVDHTFLLQGSFVPPGPLAPLFPAPLSLALRYTHGDQRECRLSPELTACSAQTEFASYLDRILGVQLDTRAAGMTFGLQIDHRDRRSRIGERSAMQQFTFGLFGQFNLSAGNLR